ncbi:MAG: hypothetical protein EXR72_19545 [Myxococcales bacterium]|nr:hypothetical protein [Myxococcales bacterium]
MELTIVETTVGDLAGISCGVGNVMDGAADLTTWGDETEETTIRVRAGATIRASGTVWNVVAIHDPPGRLGSVTLRRV